MDKDDDCMEKYDDVNKKDNFRKEPRAVDAKAWDNGAGEGTGADTPGGQTPEYC